VEAMGCIEEIKIELHGYGNPEKAAFLQQFFKTFPGGYGEGDVFIGAAVPNLRKLARKHYKSVTLEEIDGFLKESIHEYRQTALFLLVNKFQRAGSVEEKKRIVDIYLSNIEYINNWDLVDSSAPYILGAYLYDEGGRALLYELAESGHLWKQRIAILSTFYFIKNEEFEDAIFISEILLNYKHELIHKAVGWMLREIGKRDRDVELFFLRMYYKEMPRTMLRYAIERFEPELRQQFLKGEV
jgi:3-methyladenine DNA glycosylase AlkD